LRTNHVHTHRGKCAASASLMPEGKIAMTQANLRLVEGMFMDKTKALDAALPQIERAFGKGAIMRLGKNESTGLAVVEAIEPEAELFALAEQVDLAEKAFHDALARRNEAQIAICASQHQDPRGVRSGKNGRGSRTGISRRRGRMAGQHPRHDCNQAQAEGVIRFHGRQARRQHRPRHLATLRTGNRSAANPAPPRAHREKSAPHRIRVRPLAALKDATAGVTKHAPSSFPLRMAVNRLSALYPVEDVRAIEGRGPRWAA
jgi:hypothetical protein